MKTLLFKRPLWCCLLLFGTVGTALGQGRLPFLLDRLKDGGTSGYVMVAAHRGDWRHAPENSLSAFQNCIEAGIDIIEVDVRETKDGELVVMHDATLDRTTTGRGLVADKTMAEIKTFYLKDGDNSVTRHQVPTFRELLQLCKGKILIHVDKWPPVREKVLALGREQDCLEQLIFRSTYASEKVKSLFGTDLQRIHYIPVVLADTVRGYDQLDDYLRHLEFPVLGISFSDTAAPVLKRVPALQAARIRIWYNALKGARFNAGYDDERALQDLENSYGWLLRQGASVIMTDRPFLLLDYLRKNKRR